MMTSVISSFPHVPLLPEVAPLNDRLSQVCLGRRLSVAQNSAADTTTTPLLKKSALRLRPSAQSVQTRSLFIQTENTPNPESIKFLPGRDVLTEEQGEDNKGYYATISDKDEIARSPLAKEIFKVDGVKSVYFGREFVTVTKYATAHWAHLRTLIFGVIMDFYSAEKPQPALADAAIITDTTIMDDDDEVVAMIKELLETRIRPAVQEDGGDIRYVGYEEETGIVRYGIWPCLHMRKWHFCLWLLRRVAEFSYVISLLSYLLSVKLAGSCVGCPSSSVTLKNGVENMLMHYIPEITAVHAMEEDDDGNIVDSTTGEAIDVEQTKAGPKDAKKAKTYEERLAAAGIPYSD
jgi:Fe-S cluster biogenesis protein NfuA